jgi:hypothetical protein
VDSVVVLLRPEANLRAINGVYQRRLPGAPKPYLRFRYRVLRVWDLPVEEVLRAGISVLPLAPISAVSEDKLPSVIARMEQRLAEETDQARAGKLWTATGILLGMLHEAAFIRQLLSGVHGMKESTFYQAILEEGEQKGRHKEALGILLRRGTRKFKAELAAEQRAILDAITDPSRLEELIDRTDQVETWTELLAPPATPSQPGETEAPQRRTPRRRKKSWSGMLHEVEFIQ